MLGALKRKKKLFASTFKQSIIDIPPFSIVLELYSTGEMSYLISSCIPKQKRIKFYCINQFEDPSCFKSIMTGMEYIWVNEDPLKHSHDWNNGDIDFIFVNSNDPSIVKSSALFWYSKLKKASTFCGTGYENVKDVIGEVFINEAVQHISGTDLYYVNKEGIPYGSVNWEI